ncbi:MAG TPA: hypothetical protein VM925_01770 [Labilithrix sp.]|nr:hypothetical protein [Labilithrix sp.]
MPHLIFVNAFIDELVRTRGRQREDLESEFREAARRAAFRRFGDATPIEVTFSELGLVEFWQELDVVASVTDKRREVASFDLKSSSANLDFEEGDGIRLPIYYFDVITLDLNRRWIDYGFVLTLEEEGKPPSRYEPRRGDHDVNIHEWTALPSSEAARGQFLARLERSPTRSPNTERAA